MPLDDFVLYLDENIHNCKPILEILEKNAIRFERHGKNFPTQTPDEVWLPFVGEKRWIVISTDKRFRYNEYERRKVNRYKVREFYYASGNINKHEMASILLNAIPAIKKMCQRHPPPFIASMTRSGGVYLRYGG